MKSTPQKKLTIHLLITLLLMMYCSVSCKSEDKSSLFIPKKVAEGFDFPEGPAWDGSKSLYVSNCYGGWISKYEHGRMDTFVTKQQSQSQLTKTNGLTIGISGNIFACDFGLNAILEITPQGQISTLLSGFQGQKFNRPNDLAFDPKGNLYFTDPKSYGADQKDGVVYAFYREKGIVTPVFQGLAFPNGIAFSADASFLYVCESALNRILKFPVHEDGGLGNYDIFAELPGGDPDGIAFDRAGNLYVAHFGSGSVFVLNRRGTIQRTITIPGKKPTNLEFAGTDLRTLFITEVETNALYELQVDVPGLRLFSSPGSE